ncbi:putative RNA-binding protein [Encephalitozoon romaleae SJ-2008]|uniref:RNA-binding protein n=1 Tax=Encephalitozoon romaleae (strain SJ-2008) TaxID=1178016 RepID=I7AFD4_ENCRO|nr:putative RNA-binding protein [Encephalitozoon romaleae SJ-2008]AFN83415.1 putative RNA-binding protein [Encephalitozoon romaleae SJ-2008]
MERGLTDEKHKLFITNIPTKTRKQLVYELLTQVSKISNLYYNQDKGYCFVSYETHEELDYTYKVLQGVKLYGKRLYFSKVEEQVRVVVRNIGQEIDEVFLWDVFSKFGPCHVEIDGDGLGIVVYRRKDSAIKAVDTVNRKIIGYSEVFVEIDK